MQPNHWLIVVTLVLIVALPVVGPQTAPAQSPSVLLDIMPGSSNSLPARFVDVLGTVFFTAASSGSGHALWKTDGTPGGTAQVKDFIPGPSGGVQPRELVGLGPLLICIGDDGVNGGELWRSDGTGVGTTMILNINPGNQGRPIYMDPPTGLTVFKQRVYFSARDGIHGRELWSSDGSASGTRMLRDIRPGGNTSDSLPTYFTPVGDTLFFFAYDTTHGWELWKTDGTSAATTLVKDVWPGPEPTLITHNNFQFVTGVLGNLLIFAAPDATHGFELWRSDGTGSGTYRLKDITPGPGHSRFSRNLTAVGGHLLFTADDGVHGPELWRTDGTSAGTTLVMDIRPGSLGSNPGEMAALSSGLVVFGADDGVNGAELWRTDGTAAGTTLVTSIRSGPTGSLLYYKMFGVGSRFAYFPANDGLRGTELWRSDGTASGTTLVQDLAVGSSGSYPEFLTLSAGRLIFRAQDSAHGQEPRVLFPGATSQERGTTHSLPGVQVQLRADDPVLGRPFTVHGTAARIANPIALVIGFPGPPLPLSNGGRLYLNLVQPFDLFAWIQPASLAWSRRAFLPNLPALTGTRCALQAFQALPSTSLGYDSTNGVIMTIGR